MEITLQRFKRYLQDTLGLHIDPKPLKEVGEFPRFLLDHYGLYTASLLGKPCVLAVDYEGDVLTPAAIRKHLDMIREKTKVSCIYISNSASFYNRKRLIGHCVQFVIINRQIYLPALGIDWVESCRDCHKPRAVPKTMAASTQIVMIYALMHKTENEFIPLKLAEALKYTPMTMTRALNELELLNLGKTVRKGKERQIKFETSSLLWQRAQPFMQSPVKKRIWLKANRDAIQKIKHLGVLAGFSALGELTMLSSPTHPIYAISRQAWKELQKSSEVEEIPLVEDSDIELEIWGYDPMLCANKGHVDLFSLYLSLREIQDERVESALEELMKEIKW